MHAKKQSKTIEWKRLEICSRKLEISSNQPPIKINKFKKIKKKKIRDIKGIFHAKMGSIKDRNGMDLTEAEDN